MSNVSICENQKRAPAPLIRVPSLKCSQSKVMPPNAVSPGGHSSALSAGGSDGVSGSRDPTADQCLAKTGKGIWQGVLISSTQAIRKRLLEAGVSFAPNANIAEYCGLVTLRVTQAEVERHMQAVLDALVIHTNRDHNS